MSLIQTQGSESPITLHMRRHLPAHHHYDM
jgi:hypothetical protein